MKRLIIALLLLLPAVSIAASKQYYDYPVATSVPDSGKFLMYDPATGSKNVTGSTLRTTPSDTPISSKPISSSNQYQRVYEGRTSAGVITSYITANGIMVLGTPAVLTVSSVSPANGATGFAGPVITTTFNKDPLSLSSSYIYVNGKTTTNGYGSTQNIVQSTAYLAPSTSYTYKVVKNTLATLQTDGETTASCGSAMTDVSGVCQSTFTTGTINIYSVYPSAGSSEIPGTDGGAFGTTPQMMFGLTYKLSAGQFTCSSSYWNGSAWVADTTPGAFTNTSDIIYNLPSMIYHKSYDSSHLTTYTCSVPKSIGLTACGAGTTDTGTLCQWTFTTAP